MSPQRSDDYAKYTTIRHGYSWKYATLARHLDNGVPLQTAKTWAHLSDVPDEVALANCARYRGRDVADKE